MAKLVVIDLKVSRTETKATHPVGKGTPELHWNKSAIVFENGDANKNKPDPAARAPLRSSRTRR